MTGGQLVDLVLVVAALSFAVSGYRQGFVIGALSFVGFFGGGFAGTQIAPAVATEVADGPARPIVGVAVVLLLAAIGQAVAVVVGQRVRARLRSRSSRTVDSLGGAIMSTIAVLLVAWMVATPLASSRFTGLARAIRHSAVIATVNQAMPNQFVSAYAGFRHLLDKGDFPEVFGPLTPTDVPSVEAPNISATGTAGVGRAQRSIVKIVGDAPGCSRRLEGSGFVYSTGRVMTNAHVVAGVRSVTVQQGARPLRAHVVLYDPERDVAVLDVPGLDRRALSFAGPAVAGASATVAGYPLDGPYATVPARIRGVQDARGPDIYQNQQVTRQIYALRSDVRSGNSGGPLLSPTGAVYGVVFAAAADDPATGFALTAAEVASDARAGIAAAAAVSTRSCD